MAHLFLFDQPLGQNAKDRSVFVGNKLVDMMATISGFTEYLVERNDEVKKGQAIATQHNALGDVVYEYKAEIDGRVAIIGTDAIREHGVLIATILGKVPECEKRACDYEGEVH